MSNYIKFILINCLFLSSFAMSAQTFMDQVNKYKEQQTKPVEKPTVKPTYQPATQNTTPSTYGKLPGASAGISRGEVNIKNRWKGTYIHNEYGAVQASALGKPGWHSGQWIFETVRGDAKYVRIKNKWKGTYLHIERGVVESSKLGEPEWHSAQWLIEKIPGTNFFRLKNRWKGTYLHTEYGNIACGTLGKPDWHSAQWESKTPGSAVAGSTKSDASYGPTAMMYFRYTDQVQGGNGLNLQVGSQIIVLPNQTVKSSPGISFDPNSPKICGKRFTVASLSPLKFTQPFPENMRNTNNSSFALKVAKIR